LVNFGVWDEILRYDTSFVQAGNLLYGPSSAVLKLKYRSLSIVLLPPLPPEKKVAFFFWWGVWDRIGNTDWKLIFSN
jgi:hypothetical protein